jgi:hypothetical protein
MSAVTPLFVTFHRSTPQPGFSDQFFPSLAEAQEHANRAVSVVGQELKVIAAGVISTYEVQPGPAGNRPLKLLNHDATAAGGDDFALTGNITSTLTAAGVPIGTTFNEGSDPTVLLRQMLSPTTMPSVPFVVLPNGSVTQDTTSLTIAFLNHAELVGTLVATDITLSAGITRGTLVKVSDAIYTLSVTQITGGPHTMTINKANVVGTPFSFSTFIAPDIPVVDIPETFTVTANGNATTTTTQLTITLSDTVTPALAMGNISVTGDGITATGLTPVSGTVFNLAVNVTEGGLKLVSINHPQISTAPIPVIVHQYTAPVPLASFTVEANGNNTTTTDEVTITFTNNATALSGLTMGQLQFTSGITATSLTRVGTTNVWTVGVNGVTSSGIRTLTINNPTVVPEPQMFFVHYFVATVASTFSISSNGSQYVTTTEIVITFHEPAAVSGFHHTQMQFTGGGVPGGGIVTKSMVPVPGRPDQWRIEVETTVDGLKTATVMNPTISGAATFQGWVAGALATFEVIANGGPTQTTTELTYQFSQPISPDITWNMVEFTTATIQILSASDWIKVNDTTYKANVLVTGGGSKITGIYHPALLGDNAHTTFNVHHYVPSSTFAVTPISTGGTGTSTDQLQIAFANPSVLQDLNHGQLRFNPLGITALSLMEQSPGTWIADVSVGSAGQRVMTINNPTTAGSATFTPVFVESAVAPVFVYGSVLPTRADIDGLIGWPQVFIRPGGNVQSDFDYTFSKSAPTSNRIFDPAQRASFNATFEIQPDHWKERVGPWDAAAMGFTIDELLDWFPVQQMFVAARAGEWAPFEIWTTIGASINITSTWMDISFTIGGVPYIGKIERVFSGNVRNTLEIRFT